MGVFKFKLPDVGEGVTEAEIVEWRIKAGDDIAEDDNMVDVMTDKATVELPSPVSGKVKALNGEPGDIIATGTVIVEIEVEGDVPNQEEEAAPEPEPKQPEKVAEEAKASEAPKEEPEEKSEPKPEPAPKPAASAPKAAAREDGERPLASPAVRKRALDSDIDLGAVPGTGPAGRITHQDMDDFIASGGRLAAAAGGGSSRGLAKRTGEETSKIIGLRRKIAENMAKSKRTIPHFAYVEEIDVTDLESLRQHLNATRKDGQPKLTILPFLMTALCRALPDFPAANANYDEESNELTRFEPVHCGIATATQNGLMVPVVRHAEALSIWDQAAEISRLAEAARTGKATKDELTGSTITITSLGAMGGVASTPVINAPETAIIGVNKMQELPRYDAKGRVAPRLMMNLSSSFDHRMVDGYDAASLIQALKAMLENPATIFME
ncbi:dihydrolipoamide acetyltransferase family protein [Euryhalocaulis caribicus]|uniref:dihydrolipoamide acetyltransferase family protein n=1 Tax=Euryhalocaulis caribicus TaxID=1161401 RepID=UPI00039C77B4|nr:dihydrolipoamide acetyltransferase family protein [Euryhalocaulis caribicus]